MEGKKKDGGRMTGTEQLRERQPDFPPAATWGREGKKTGVRGEWQMRRERMCQEEEYCTTRDAIGMHAMLLVPWRERMRRRARRERGKDRKRDSDVSVLIMWLLYPGHTHTNTHTHTHTHKHLRQADLILQDKYKKVSKPKDSFSKNIESEKLCSVMRRKLKQPLTVFRQ